MVMLWNYLPYLILIVFTIIAMALVNAKKYRLGYVALFIGVILTWFLSVTTSYTPKGEPKRTQLEQFEAEELEMQDRLSKPDNNSEFRKERAEARKQYEEKVK